MLTKAAQPRWFMMWLLSTWLAIGLFVIVMLAAVFVIAPNEIPSEKATGNLTSSGLLTLQVIVLTFIAASVLGLMAIILGPALNLWKKKHNPSVAVAWGRLLGSLLFVVGAFAFTLLIAVPVFSNVNDIIDAGLSEVGLSGCPFTFRLVAFEDPNHTGVFAAGERGLAGIVMTANHPSQRSVVPSDTASTATSSTAVTDNNGRAAINLSYEFCPNAATEHGKVTLTVETPPGYQATTPTTFGPFTIQWRERETSSVRTVYAGFTRTP